MPDLPAMHVSRSDCGKGFVLRDADGRKIGSRVFPTRKKATTTRGKYRSGEVPVPGAKSAETVERACLCCGAKFDSEGAHNRLCYTCRRRSEGPVPGLTSGLPGRRVRMGAGL